MSGYELKTGKVGDAVVGACKAVEDTVVSGYKRVEDVFVETFLEKTDDDKAEGQNAWQTESFRKSTTMKKLLVTVLCAAAILAGAWIIWKIVLPFLGTVIGGLLPGRETLCGIHRCPGSAEKAEPGAFRHGLRKAPALEGQNGCAGIGWIYQPRHTSDMAGPGPADGT